MQKNRIRAISFDLDDTLWPFRPCLIRAEAALLSWLRTHAPGTRELLAEPAALMTYRAKAHADFPALRTDLSALRLASIRTLLEAGQEDPTLAQQAFDVFFEQRQRVELYPEVLEALTQLSQRLPLVALSNGNACVHKAGIGQFFKGALSAATLGIAKPQAEAFHAAAALAGVQPAELLHVGDDWHLDVIGAVGAGAQAAWVVREEEAVTADEQAGTLHTKVGDLAHLCEVLAHERG
ncbi:putative hydrolase of the HAD superfamily [Roseateles sp. YR242]|nr:putative hydrolase of the HAD superfamily [Roseateles sp. YR242]